MCPQSLRKLKNGCTCLLILCAFFAWGERVKKSIGFYIFISLVVVLVGVCIWSYVVTHDEDVVHYDIPKTPDGYIQTQVMPDEEKVSPKSRGGASVEVVDTALDGALLDQTLNEGYFPTQDIGELGSKNGALYTDYPMNYKPTKYERLPNSPLLIFTDDMIWKAEDGVYYAKRDAMADQAFHYQESAIALSVAPKYEKGQLAGYRLVEIPEGTLFAKLGLVSGDSILSINGTKPDMEPMALAFVNMVAGKQGRTTIEVEHRGKKSTIQIRAAE